MDRSGYVRIDAEYLLEVRPHLTDREARVYEAVILMCDGWDRPTTTSAIASITRLHIDHVRKSLRSLEQLKLIGCTWIGARTNPNGARTVTILRDFRSTVRVLRALGRIGPELNRPEGSVPIEALDQIGPELPPQGLGQNGPELPEAMGQNGPETLGRNSPKTLGRNGPKHLTRSDPDQTIPPHRC